MTRTLAAHLIAAWLGLNLGLIAAFVVHYRRDRTFDAHVADALAVAAPEPVLPAAMWDVCTCADAVWTDAELVKYAPLLAELDAVTTYDDFIYSIGGDL